jgi:hypothetical protein
MPLTAAFLHIKQVVGGEELAEEDLRLRLVSGELEAQDRLVTRSEGIEIIPLAPEDFKGPDGLLFSRISELLTNLGFAGNIGLLSDSDFLRRVERYRSHGHNFFLRRAEVQRMWPTTHDAERPPQAAPPALPVTPPAGIGPKVWLAAQEVYKLRREGGRWINIEKDLLGQIRKRLGGDEWLSKTTLKSALAYLRKDGLIDL